ncbi:MAG: ATP-binding protein [bacterium]|nr:ATP-binding protein [bacterium]
MNLSTDETTDAARDAIIRGMSDFLAGTVKGPGKEPHDFIFITRDNNRMRIGEFVYYSAEIAGEQRRIIGTVKDRKLAKNLPDSFFADPLTPPSAIALMIGIEGDTEIYEITASAIGYFSHKLGDFVNPRIPPQPGDGVYLASSETLGEMLSPRRIGETGSAHIGSLLTREPGEVPIVLSVRDVVSTHLAILASTGSGKSYTAGVFIEELMQQHNRAAVLIVDPHGEYHTLSTIQGDSQFAGADGYQPEVKIFTPDKIKVRFSTLTEADIKYLLPEGTSDKMLHYLGQAFRSLQDRLKAEGRRDYLYNYFDLREEVQRQQYGNDKEAGDGGNVSSIQGLLWRLDSRFDRDSGIFHAHDHLQLQELYKPGRVTILQLSNIEQHEQQVIVGTLLRRVNKARMATTREEATSGENFLDYPVFTLLEEAHRFAPAGASVVSTHVLRQILSEGRKFGVGIGLITQRPGKLDQDVLSQCMTQIIMRIVNPIDQQTVAQSVEGAGREMLAELPALTKGQAIICGVGVNTPVMCRIRPRLTEHGGETFDAPSEWMKWHSSKESIKRTQDEAPYLKPGSDKKPEKIGNIRI